MSGYIGIIIAVIVFIGYIARSVEKQNERERKRRAARRTAAGHRTASAPIAGKNAVPAKRRKEPPVSDNQLNRYHEAMHRMAENSQADSGKMAPSPPAERLRNRPRWMNNPDRLRQAFIFSECIGKPRARSPHPYFKKKRPGRYPTR